MVERVVGMDSATKVVLTEGWSLLQRKPLL